MTVAVVAWLAVSGCSPPAHRAAGPKAARASARAALGRPVVSKIPPAVVPANAELEHSLSGPTVATYSMPVGTTVQQVLAWYRAHMAPNADFAGMRWVEERQAGTGGAAVWYWCAGPGEVLDIAFGERQRPFVAIAVQRNASDTRCA